MSGYLLSIQATVSLLKKLCYINLITKATEGSRCVYKYVFVVFAESIYWLVNRLTLVGVTERSQYFVTLWDVYWLQEWDPKLPGLRDYPELRAAVRRWSELQDGQRILVTTPSVLVGYRVEVYRAEGTTQWYTAVIVSYNEATRVCLFLVSRHVWNHTQVWLSLDVPSV